METKEIQSINKSKNKSLRVLFTDGTEIRVLTDDAVEFNLRAGEPVDLEIITLLDKNYQKKTATSKAFSLLARRPYSEKEIRDKLKKNDFDSDVIEIVLDDLKEQGYIDDLQLAKDFVSYKMDSAQDGYMKIKSKLYKKGIPPAIIEEALDEIYNREYETEAIKKLIQKKIHKYPKEMDPQKKREKLLRYLKTKGFSRSAIVSILLDYDI